jgi:hypothetical protein
LLRGSGALRGSGLDQLDEIAKQFSSAKYIGGTLTYGYRPDGTKEMISGAVKTLIQKRTADAIPVNVSRDVFKLQNSASKLNLLALQQKFASEGRALTSSEIGFIQNVAIPAVDARVASGAAPVDDDKYVAALMAAALPLEKLVQLTDAMGVAGDEPTRRGAVADSLVVMARLNQKTLRAFAASKGFTVPGQDDPAAAGSAGIFDSIGQKLKDVDDVAREKLRAVQTGIGVALQQVGRGILALTDKAPWASQFFFKPLGIHLAATAIAELGDAVRDGSINTFDETRLTYSMASWFKAVGQALATAAPFTGPWAPLFAAVGAANVAIGQTIKTLVDNHAARSHSQDVHTSILVDQYGRQVDAAGRLVDPLQRAVSAQHATGAAAQPAQQPAQQPALQRGTDGNYYGWVHYPEFGWLWTGFVQVSATQVAPRFAWIPGEQRWAPVGSGA